MITQDQIEQAVKRISAEIGFHEEAVFICVLNGAFMFFSDLLKKTNCIEAKVDFIRVKSYQGTVQKEIQLIKDLEENIEGKTVYLIDDIYDSGNTIKHLIEHLSKHNPKTITPVALFKRKESDHPDLIYGIELGKDMFIYGYGLDDSQGFNRNLPFALGE